MKPNRFLLAMLLYVSSMSALAATEWDATAHARTGLPFSVLREIPELDDPAFVAEVEALVAAVQAAPTDESNIAERIDTLVRYHDALQNSGLLINYRIGTELNFALRARAAGILEEQTQLFAQFDQRLKEMRKSAALRGNTGRFVLRTPRKPELNAKTYETVVIDYIVDTPLEPGARIRLGQNWYSDLGRIQFSRPLAENYATVESSRDDVEFLFASRVWFGNAFTGLSGGNRPMIVLKEGRLEPGDVISFTFGDRSEGSPGWMIQSFTNDAMDLRFETDFNGDGAFVAIGQPRFRVYGNHASHVRAVAPSVVRPGEAFTVRASVEDHYFNRAAIETPRVLELWQGENRLARTRAKRGDPATFIFDDVTPQATEGEPLWLEVRSTDGTIRGMTNPIVPKAEGPRLYWGELHGHEGYTDANGSPEWYMQYAKDVAFLDFASLTGHDLMLSEVHYRHNELATQVFNVPDEGFITFRAYEWTNGWAFGGHHNVFLLDDRQHPVTVMEAPRLKDMVRAHREMNDPDKVLIIPHAHQPGDWNVAGADLVEIFSQHGSFEWFGREYLQKGHKVGINAASDDHLGHPGNSPSRGKSRGGLGAVFADELERENVFGHLKARHTYGTSLARIYLETETAGAPMGDSVKTSGPVNIDGLVAGTDEIADITLVVNGEGTQTLQFDEPAAEGSRLRFRITVDSTPGDNPNAPRTPRSDRRYWGRIFIHRPGDILGLSNGSTARARIESVTPLGNEYYADRVVHTSNHEAVFTFRVRGDHDGALLDLTSLDPDDQVTVRIVTSPMFDIEHWNMQELPKLPGEYFNMDVPRQSVVLEETVRVGDLLDASWQADFDERATADMVILGEPQPKSREFSFVADEDDGLKPGDANHIYVRVRQIDDETAWSSPVFIDWQAD